MTPPKFFLPLAEPHEYETAYAALASLVRKPAPAVDLRIYSITYRHDGEEWTATVGEQLRGHTIPNPRSRSKRDKIQRPVGDAAIVIAIFPGVPFVVFTDRGTSSGGHSAWENPFLAGNPRAVSYFTQ